MNWLNLEARVDRTMARAFGESVRLSFMASGVTDTTRAQVTVRAVLHTDTETSEPMGPAGTFRSRAAIGTAQLLLDRSTYAGPMPVRGDRVRALDRVSQPWFEVAHVSDRDTNIIVVSLG